MDQMRDSIADIAVEAWRFQNVFGRMLAKMDPSDARRYANQYQWFYQRVNAAVEKAGLNIVNVEGQPFDAGMAVTPLNIDDFDAKEEVRVAQMIEPVVMHDGRVIRTGTVILERTEA